MDIKKFWKSCFDIILKMNTYFYICIFLVIFLCVKEILCDLNYEGIVNFFLEFKELFITLIGAYFAFRGLKYTLLDLLDSKSEWRKKIYDVASKEKYTMDDIFRLRASLRHVKKKEIVHIDEYKIKDKDTEIKCFDDFSDACIGYFDKKINKYYEEMQNNTNNPNNVFDKNKIITFQDEKLIRIICMVLLKNHWEYNSSLSFFDLLINKKKDKHNSKPQAIISEASEKIAEINEEYNKN